MTATIYYGPATSALIHLLDMWRATTWFDPPLVDDARAAGLFHAYNARAHAAMPDTFAATVAVRHERGGWPEFVAQWRRVSTCDPTDAVATWDWFYSVLKPLALAHSRRHGLELSRHPACVDLDLDHPLAKQVHKWRPNARRTPEDPLFFRIAPDSAVWDVPLPAFTPTDAHGHTGRDYASYALGNFTYALEWQLAGNTADLADNPFAPLLQLYAARVYPFVPGRDEATLFSFV